MDLSTITVADFRARFLTDFQSVSDQHVQNSFDEAKMSFNQGLFDNDAQITLAFLYLSAHYLSHDLKASNAGTMGTAPMLMNSRTVGSVSESYSIPEKYLKNPQLAFYTTSFYGLKYLSFCLPKLVGNVGIAYGDTMP